MAVVYCMVYTIQVFICMLDKGFMIVAVETMPVSFENRN
jgi:hypothetical protein